MKKLVIAPFATALILTGFVVGNSVTTEVNASRLRSSVIEVDPDAKPIPTKQKLVFDKDNKDASIKITPLDNRITTKENITAMQDPGTINVLPDIESHRYPQFQKEYSATTVFFPSDAKENTKVHVEYSAQGTYRDKRVKASFDYAPKGYDGHTGKVIVQFSQNAFSGFSQQGAPAAEISNFQVRDADTGEVYEFNNDAFLAFNSLNGITGNTDKNKIGEFAGYTNQDPSSDVFLSKNNKISEVTDPTGLTKNKVFGGWDNSFEDELGSSTFIQNSVQFQLKGKSANFYLGTTRVTGWGSSFWMSLSSATLFNTIPEKPTKDVFNVK